MAFSEIGGQSTDSRGQKSEVGRQISEVRKQKSENRSKELKNQYFFINICNLFTVLWSLVAVRLTIDTRCWILDKDIVFLVSGNWFPHYAFPIPHSILCHPSSVLCHLISDF